jgi:hypothetical protein
MSEWLSQFRMVPARVALTNVVLVEAFHVEKCWKRAVVLQKGINTNTIYLSTTTWNMRSQLLCSLDHATSAAMLHCNTASAKYLALLASNMQLFRTLLMNTLLAYTA